MEAFPGSPQWSGLWTPHWLHAPGTLQRSYEALQNISPSDSRVAWISDITHAVATGYLHIAVLAVSLVSATIGVRRSRRNKPAASNFKASRIAKRYEFPSQLARAAALAFTIAAAVTGDFQQWYIVALVAAALLLGLTRLANDLDWRHIALHQVNFLTTASLLLLVADEVLPMLDLASDHRPTGAAYGAMASLAAAVVLALCTPREWAPPPVSFELIQRPIDAEPSPEETCSWWTKFLSYGFLNSLVWKGCRRQVDLDELPPLPWYDEPLLLLSRVQDARRKSKSTLTTTLRFMRFELSLMVLYTILDSTAELVSPFAMYQLLAYISSPDTATLSPVLWLFLLFAGPMAKTVAFQQYIFTSTRLIVRVKSGMVQELYHRALSSMEIDGDILNNAQGKEATAKKITHAGQLQNLMSGDIDAITEARDIIMTGIGAPYGSVIAFIGLYKIMGWPALLGIALLILSVPLPAYVAQLMGKSQRQVKATQDARISLISEYLSSIRTVKYFAWEDAMAAIIDKSRKAEQKVLWRIALLWTLLGQVSEVMPMLSLVLMFVLYTAVLKEPLTAQVAFTSLSLVAIMRNNIAMLSYVARNAMNAWISFGRLDRYFNNTKPLVRYPEGPLRLQKATLKRNAKADFVLRDVSLEFVEGGLNTVQGASGSGKTTLLLSILGETIKETGDVTRPDDVAFASQTSWLQNASVRDNILFASKYEEVRYQRVIEACCLPTDLAELEKGDETEVGENGTALSGGQKARVALARALYSKAPLLLLDDIFSALDAKTAASVWELCFCGDLLKGRTVVLVTQINWIAEQSDLAVRLEGGSVVRCEQNIGVVRRPIQLTKDVVEEVEDKATNGVHETGADGVNGTNGVSNGKSDGNGNGIATKPASAAKKDEIADEMKATGKTGRLSFFEYMIYFGGVGYAVFALLASAVSTAAYLGINLWVGYWVDSVESGHAKDISFYLGIYTALSVGTLLLDAVVYLIYANGGWHAAKKLHATFIRSVLNVSLDWYKNTPTGRIVNRFSRDMASLDNALYRLLQGAAELFFKLVLGLGAISSIMPVFLLPGTIAVVVGVAAGELYTRTAVVVKRLVQSSQSPVFSQFSDDMAGLQIIRARRDVPGAFAHLLARRLRSFNRASETNFNLNRWVAMRIDFATAIVTTLAGVIAISKIGLISAGLVGFSLTNATHLSETILYMVRITNDLEVELQSFHRVKEYASLEPEEKADEAPSKPKPAAPSASDVDGTITHTADPPTPTPTPASVPVPVPASWPRTGAVEFRNVTVRYDPDGPDILKDINLTIGAGERVAVVGRTGSGKSTLVLSLLRFTTIAAGQILYDGVDITGVARRRLRRALTIIPQEAVLFNGTVGTNLAPAGDVSPADLAAALRSCEGIASFQFHGGDRKAEDSSPPQHADQQPPPPPPTEQTPLLSAPATPTPTTATATGPSTLTLDTTVDARGENFSHGQRQVLSLCRALVRRGSRLMLLDEATASMDYETDRGIQAVLRREMFAAGSGRTLITIAHRLRTIADYDRVIVMGGGRVLEMGSPKELFSAKGDFYDMVQHSGEVQELEAMFASED